MSVREIFMSAMALIDEMTSTGSIDETTTAEFKASAPHIITMLQNELIGIENRYRKVEDYVYPVKLESLDDYVEIDDVKANTLLVNGLAAHLMLHEDTALANFFQSRYEEMKALFLKKTPKQREKIEDVYDCSLNY